MLLAVASINLYYLLVIWAIYGLRGDFKLLYATATTAYAARLARLKQAKVARQANNVPTGLVGALNATPQQLAVLAEADAILGTYKLGFMTGRRDLMKVAVSELTKTIPPNTGTGA
jgi:hypothetical protein